MPMSQCFLAAISILLLAGQAHADESAILRCRQIPEAAQRLSCYDAIAFAASTPTQVRPSPAEFGLIRATADTGVEAIESDLVGELDGWGSNTLLRLSNGQVWRIADDSSGVVRPDTRKVRIRRGALGAFYIEFEGMNRSPRVRRVQ